MRVITLHHSTGGVGRTTTAVNLAGALAEAGHSTLLIDLDPAGDASAALGIPARAADLTAADALEMPERAAEHADQLVWNLSANLSVIPSSPKLLRLDTTASQLASSPSRDQRLSTLLNALPEKPDAVVIDTPAALGVLSLNALYAADTVLVPCRTDPGAIRNATRHVALATAAIRALTPAPPTTPDVRCVPRLAGDDELHETVAARLIAEPPAPLINDPDGSGALILPYDTAADHAAVQAEPVTRAVPESPLAHACRALAQAITSRPKQRVHALVETKPGIVQESEAVTRLSISTARPAIESDRPEPKPESKQSAETPNPAAVLAEPKIAPAPSPLSHRAAELAARVDTVKRTTRASEAVRLADPRVKAAMDNAAREASRADAARSLFGVRPTSRGLLFVIPAGQGAVVTIEGTFNDWTPEEASHNPVLDAYEALIDATAGTHRYRVLVNGAQAELPNQQTADIPGRGACGIVIATQATASVA